MQRLAPATAHGLRSRDRRQHRQYHPHPNLRESIGHQSLSGVLPPNQPKSLPKLIPGGIWESRGGGSGQGKGTGQSRIRKGTERGQASGLRRNQLTVQGHRQSQNREYQGTLKGGDQDESVGDAGGEPQHVLDADDPSHHLAALPQRGVAARRVQPAHQVHRGIGATRLHLELQGGSAFLATNHFLQIHHPRPAATLPLHQLNHFSDGAVLQTQQGLRVSILRPTLRIAQLSRRAD